MIISGELHLTESAPEECIWTGVPYTDESNRCDGAANWVRFGGKRNKPMHKVCSVHAVRSEPLVSIVIDVPADPFRREAVFRRAGAALELLARAQAQEVSEATG
jgi:hypothetical protein